MSIQLPGLNNPDHRTDGGMPFQLKCSFLMIGFQALLSVAGGGFMAYMATYETDYGQTDGASLLAVIGTVGIVMGVGLGVLGVLALRRRYWAYMTIVVLEWVNAAALAIALLTTGNTAVISGLALCVAVALPMRKHIEWITD